MIIRTDEETRRWNDPNDYIKIFISDVKKLKKDATDNGQKGLVDFANNVLDFIEYAKADSLRLSWLEGNKQHLNIQAQDLRAWIDKQMEA